MYYTHYFANHETLARAQACLSQLGFAPERIEIHTDGIPRVSVSVDPARWSGIGMLINAIERGDPAGWPGFWDVAHQAHVYPIQAVSERPLESPPRGGATAIGWHPADRPSETTLDS